jgi:hypothetical protein
VLTFDSEGPSENAGKVVVLKGRGFSHAI